MVDATVSSPTPRKRRSWLRIIGWCFAILIVLLVVAYFVGTSAAFFKGVILPQVGKSLNATVTVSDASISPFKQVVLKDLKVQTTGTEPLVFAPEVRLRYSLMDIIGGHINVDEVTLSSPAIALVQNPDGSSNLDPILQSQKNKAEKPKEAQPSKPLQVDVKKVALNDATLRQTKLYKGGSKDTAEISHLNLTLDNIKNGQTAKLALAANINMENHPPVPGTNGLLQAKLNGSFSLALTQELKPASIQGTTRFEVSRAEGALAQVAALAATLDCDITPTDIKQVALRFQKGGTPLGELRVNGPFNMEKTEGHLTVQVANIDKNLLNLAGTSSGVDFGPTTINSTNDIQLANGGAAITAAGQFNLNQLQLTRTNQTTPPLDLRAEYNVSVDRTAGNALIRAFTLSGEQKGNQFLKGELTSPMTFSWGNTSNAVGDSALKITVTRLDLADWKTFVGDVAPAGTVNMKLQLLSQQAGKQLSFDLDSKLDNLTAGSGSNQITQATVTFQINGKAADFKQFNLLNYKLEVARQNQSLVSFSGSGTYDNGNKTADMQLNGQIMLARLLQALPRPDMQISSGTAELKAHLTQKQDQQNVNGHLTLSDLKGKYGDYDFRGFGTAADLDVGMNPQQVQVRKISGQISEGGQPGGSFELSGTYLTNKSANLNAKLTDFNQNGLRPFLEPMLADKKLISVAINANAATQYDPQGASSVKADLQVTNLVVNDPKGQFPSTPLETRMQVDASLNKQVADIRQFQVALTPTARATNQVQLTGKVDMSDTNGYQGSLKLAADSLDLTSYYDLFGGKKNAPEKQPAPNTAQNTPAPPAGGANQDTATNHLPFRNFTADASIRRLYLHEMEIADFQTTTKIDGGAVTVNPCKLNINGAPINSTVNLDLGIPGYKYDLSFSAQAVPLAPLVDSFQPERKGQIGGTFSAHAKVSGTGTSGASLQKTLTGQFDMGSTNLNLSVVNIKSPVLKTLVNVIAIIPELVKNPEASLSSFAQTLTGRGQGGLADELSKSPIDSIVARGVAGSGKVDIQQAVVQSSAFRADASGTVTLAPVLTNSPIRFPVSVSLSQSIAQRLNLAPSTSPTNAPYAKLPDFLTLTGTVGKPDKEINKMALLSLAAKGLGGLIPNVGGGKAGGVLQGLGGLLGTGSKTNAAPNAATNAPPTNQSPVGNLLKGLLNPKK